MTWTIPPRSEIDGLAYSVAGQGEPLLLLHGVGLRAEAWAPQVAHLSRSHRVIAVDSPGHGDSRPLPGQPGLRDYVARIADFLDTLACGPVNVAGHSLGALLALGLAVERPAQVLRVAALTGVHNREPAARAAVVARARAMLAGNVDNETPLLRWFGARPEGAEAEAREHTARWLAMTQADGYAAAYSAFAHGDDVYAGHLHEIHCPALFLTGELDPNSTPAMSRAMAAACPRGRAVVVPGQRHMLGMVAPDAVNAALDQLLAEPLAAQREAMA